MSSLNKTCLFISAWRSGRLAAGCVRYKASVAAAQAVQNEEAKPFSELPTPKGLPVIGTLLEVLKESQQSHKWFLKKHTELGPIFRNNAGIIDMVFVADAEAIGQLLRQDGKYPERLQIDAWKDHRKRHDIPLGLLMSDGEQWHNLRRVVDKPMLKVKTVNSYAPELNEVAAEFINRMYHVRSSDNSIPQLDEELFGWSVESICRILFEKSMGCLHDQRDPDTQAFIDSSHAIFENTRKVVMFPAWLAKIISRKTWSKLEEAWETLFRVAFKTIDEKLEDIESKAGSGEEVGFLATFLNADSFTKRDIYGNVSELMGAAIDTTSNTTMMLLYEISRNPEIQKTLYEEVNRIIPPGEQATSKHLKDMHYLKAVIKETLRMYPIGSAVMRKMQKDVDVLGYRLPKETMVCVVMYVLGRDPRYYDDPDTFRPERWLRQPGQKKIHPFAWLPFGFGPRMCIGRRVAELEIQLLISQLVKKFHIEPVSSEPIELKTDLLLLPKTPVQIRLIDRT